MQNKKICEILEKEIGKIEIEAISTDNAKIKFDNYEDLGKYDNPSDMKIIGLIITTGNIFGKKYIKIDLSYFGNIFEIKSELQKALELRYKINNILKSCVPWYFIFSKMFSNIYKIYVFLLLLLITILFKSNILNKISNYFESIIINSDELLFDETNLSITIWFNIITILAFLLAFFVFLFREKLVSIFDYIFPMRLFAFGHEKTKEKTKDMFRKGFLISIVAAFVISIIF